MLLPDLLTTSYLQHFLASPSTLATVVGLGLLAVVVALGVRRDRVLVLCTGISAAAVGGLTLAPSRGWTTLALLPEPLEAVRANLRPSADDLWAWTVADGPANVALFVPFALCCGLLLRRPAAALAIGVAVSVLVESYQAATGTRVGTSADVVANSLGALVGAVLSAAVLVVAGGRPARPRGRVGR